MTELCDNCNNEAEYWTLGGGKLCKKCAEELGLIFSKRNAIKNYPTYAEWRNSYRKVASP